MLCCDFTVSMLVQCMITALCNERFIHTNAVNLNQSWRRTPVRQDQKASRKCSFAHTYITLIIAHMAYKFAPMELNKMQISHRSLQKPLTTSHFSTRSEPIRSMKHSMIPGPILRGLTALHVLYSASFPVFSEKYIHSVRSSWNTPKCSTVPLLSLSSAQRLLSLAGNEIKRDYGTLWKLFITSHNEISRGKDSLRFHVRRKGFVIS